MSARRYIATCAVGFVVSGVIAWMSKTQPAVDETSTAGD